MDSNGSVNLAVVLFIYRNLIFNSIKKILKQIEGALLHLKEQLEQTYNTVYFDVFSVVLC